jgi:ubiquitin-like protein Pup
VLRAIRPGARAGDPGLIVEPRSQGGAGVPQEQEQRRVQRKGGDAGAEGEAGQVEQTSKSEKLKEEMDEILDEIDSVLEENAEEFVKSYVQKGGE